MPAQATVIADTIKSLKKAIARKADDSESDEPNEAAPQKNRLKRKSSFSHDDLTSSRRPYRRKITHAGYDRFIVGRNPPRVNAAGEDLDDEEEDEEAEAAVADDNPYADIRLEYTLAPLTSAADLPNHPTLSYPYLSSNLTEMSQRAAQMIHKERTLLWNIKQLLTKFRGDEVWIPCGDLETDNDIALFGPIREMMTQSQSNGVQQNGTKDPRATHTVVESTDQHIEGSGAENGPSSEEHDPTDKKTGLADVQGEPTTDAANGDAMVVDDDSKPLPETAEVDAFPPEYSEKETDGPPTTDNELAAAQVPEDSTERQVPPSAMDTIDGVAKAQSPDVPPSALDDGPESKAPTKPPIDGEASPSKAEDNPEATDDLQDDQEDESQPPAHRMTTRAQAQAASDNTTTAPTRTPSPTPSIPFIHPLFTIPAHALPSADFGLPPSEAEDTRRLLLLYVQKQEEVCRGSEKLYDGLLKADRLRRTVFKWTKAEAHVGELSDGEDWYDKEEWGLEEELKKGHEEDEDDGGTQGKKTRGRRA
ncbi:MAG: hypothetical protein M1833_007159 [Piccolia ochrophora]|nr:MAG: hypothetical protein M1833_007159 [Piccolia ochrophora]